MGDTSFRNYVKALEEDPATKDALDAARADFELARVVAFVVESNRIEGIDRKPIAEEIVAHERFLKKSGITVAHLAEFVWTVAGRPPRFDVGQNVRVGNHFPPPGGPEVEDALTYLLKTASAGTESPYSVHQQYEQLHPFMDGNGRSGRVLWAWQMKLMGHDPFALPFLHRWYYQSLDEGRK